MPSKGLKCIFTFLARWAILAYVDFMHDEFGKASRTKDQH
jgi:hypothetical protein